MAFTLRLSKGLARMTPPALAWLTPAPRRFWWRIGGGAAVEFAIIGPVLLAMLLGVFTYGSYFLEAHTVQQLANDSARAALAGLDDEERATLARESLEEGLAANDFMRGEFASIEVSRRGANLSVRVVYDARRSLYSSFASIVPAPSSSIRRSASIRLGGF